MLVVPILILSPSLTTLYHDHLLDCPSTSRYISQPSLTILTTLLAKPPTLHTMATHEQLDSTSSRQVLDPTVSTQSKSTKSEAPSTALEQKSEDAKSTDTDLNHGDTRTKLQEHFIKATGSTAHGALWDDLYKKSFVPWDKGLPNPALIDLLSERSDILPKPVDGRKLKALVPGCGKGYDVLLLAAHGYDAYGLEISSTAQEAARQVEKESGADEVYQGKGEKGSVNWISGDFFAGEFQKDVEGDGKFDLIYDYTVCLCYATRPCHARHELTYIVPLSAATRNETSMVETLQSAVDP